MQCSICQSAETPKWYSGPTCASCYQKARRARDPEHVNRIQRVGGKRRRAVDPAFARDQERKVREKPGFKDRQRNAYLKCAFGITLDDYNRMFEAQGGVCQICKKTNPPTWPRKLAVDHCHSTGKVRGLLCHHCNVALGSFKDSAESLAAAIVYLKKASA